MLDLLHQILFRQPPVQWARIVSKAPRLGQRLCLVFVFAGPGICPVSPALAAEEPSNEAASTPEDATDPAGQADKTPSIERVGLLPDPTPGWLRQTIERAHPSTQVHQLQAAEQSYLALLQASQQPTSQGLVVLLPNRGQHPDWPQIVRPLRHQLTEHGWTVLALEFPEALPPPHPPRPIETPKPDAKTTEDGEPGESTTSTAQVTAPKAPDPASSLPPPTTAAAPTTPLTPPEPRVPVDAIIDDLSRQALSLVSDSAANQWVFVGVGDGAYWATRWVLSLLADTDKPEIKLILLEARNRLPGQSQSLPDFLLTPIPVLDLSADPNASEARLRRLSAQKAGFTRYRQQRLPAGESDQRLWNRVRGFLD